MPTADDREAPAAVGDVAAEEDVHHRPGRSAAGRARRRRRSRRSRGSSCGSPRERLVPLRRLEPGEVGEQRGLDRLEQLQRRARDQQHVEDEAGDRRVRPWPLTMQHAGVEQRLLGEHDRRATASAKRPPRAQRHRRRRRLRRLGVQPRVAARYAHGTTISETNGAADDAERDHGLARGDARRRPRPRSRSARPPRRTPARRRGRTTGARRSSRARSSSRRRRAPRRRGSSRALRSRRKASWTSCGSAPARDRGTRREAGLDRERRSAAGGSCRQAARAAVGDRAREQLLDRPVDHRDDDEQRRPQQRDRPYVAASSAWLATEK